MKHNNTYFMQVSRAVWGYKISDKAKLLFFWLNELEQRYTGENEDFFFHTDAELASELGWSPVTLKRAKAELKNTDLVQIWQSHFIDQKTGRKSDKHFTAYRILK